MIRIEDCETPFGPVTIFEAKATGAITYEQGGCCQSEADRAGVSLAAYIHALYYLISQTRAQRVLLIGCGGGTLGTMLARVGRTVTIVDVNPTSFTLARQYFELARNVVCEVADGKAFLLSAASKFDAIVLDAYHGDRIPSHLQSLRFFEAVLDHLSPRGAIFANVHVQHDLDGAADRMADCMSNVWPEVRLLDAEGTLGRNAIAMAGAVSQLGLPYVQMPPVTDWNDIEKELASMRYRTVRVPR
jgi:spermidine synthase